MWLNTKAKASLYLIFLYIIVVIAKKIDKETNASYSLLAKMLILLAPSATAVPKPGKGNNLFSYLV